MRDRHLLAISVSVNLVLLGFVLVGWMGPNVITSFNPDVKSPNISPTAFIHPLASVTGYVMIGPRVYVAPSASVRGDEGQPIFIGEDSNVQDGVVLHGLETVEEGKEIPKNQVGAYGEKYSVYVGKRVSMAHQSQVHGPAKIGDDTFIGMQALVFKAEIGNNVVVEPGAKIIGVKIADGRYVSTGAIVTKQAAAEELPKITPDYAFRGLNAAVVHVNTQLADGYNGKSKPSPAH
jgi:carbonic anhydrase